MPESATGCARAPVTELLNAKEPKGWPGGVQGKGLFAGGEGPRAILTGPEGRKRPPLRQFLPGERQGMPGRAATRNS
ncbi:MAG TPA: hypothetical protein DCF73_01240 [Rhodobiaceae bacterium]|jgi:hypothetical protein|nr:hypothetical protein [Rhodobiaceae bacterium]